MQTLEPSDVLASHALFATLAPASRATLAAGATVQTCAARAAVPHFDAPPALWLIAWGTAHRRAGLGRAERLLGPGDCIDTRHDDAAALGVVAATPMVLFGLSDALLRQAGAAGRVTDGADVALPPSAALRAAGALLRDHPEATSPTTQRHRHAQGRAALLWAAPACGVFALGASVPALLAWSAVDQVWALRDTDLVAALALSVALAAAAQLAGGALAERLLAIASVGRARHGVVGVLTTAHGAGVMRTVALVVVHGALLVWVSPTLALYSLGAALLGAFVLVRLGRHLGRGCDALARRHRRLRMHVADTLGRATGALGPAAREALRHWGERQRIATQRRATRLSVVSTRVRAASHVAQTLQRLLLFIVGVRAVRHAEISMGQLVAAVALADSAWGAAVTLVGASLQGLARRASAGVTTGITAGDPRPPHRRGWRRMRTAVATQILRWRRRRRWPRHRSRATLGREGLRCEHVAMRSPALDILSDVHFEVGIGERVGVLGRTGAGKSMLARLCAGALTPTRGAVRCGGVVLHTLDPVMRRQHVALVQGGLRLPHRGSLHDLLAGENAAADRAVVRAAALLVDLDAIIVALPQGYDTPVGSVALSASVKARLALAQALVYTPRLLIVDDALASIEPAAARQLTRQLATYLPGCGFLFFSQHASALADMDRLLLLDGGTLRHPQLLGTGT